MAEKKNKTQIKSIAALASIIIVSLSNISIINENVPTWSYAFILIVLLLLIYYCLCVAIKAISNILNSNFDKVNSNIDKSYSNLNDVLSLNTNKISESIDNSTSHIKDVLNYQSSDFDKKIMSLDNKMSSCIEVVTKLTRENANEVIGKMQECLELLNKELVNLGTSINTNIDEKTDLLKQSFVETKKIELAAKENIIASITDNYKLISTLIDQLSKQASFLQETLDSANVNLNENTEVINNTIKESTQTLTEVTSALMRSVETNIKENVSSQALDINNGVLNSIFGFKREFEAHKDASNLLINELKSCMDDGIKTVTMLVSKTETAESASEKQQQIIYNINTVTSKIEHLDETNVLHKADIIENTNNQVKDAKASVQKEMLALTDNMIGKMKDLASSIEHVEDQNTTTFSVIQVITSKLGEKFTDIHDNVEALKGLLENSETSDNANEKQRVLVESLNILSGKLDELSKNSELRKSALIKSNEMQILHVDESINRAIRKLTETDSATEEMLNLYLENISEINKTISRLDTRSENIQFVLDELKDNDNFTNVITSINGIVDVLRGEFKNSFAEVSDQILDSQIAQEALQLQLMNLNVVLRTLEKSIQTSDKDKNKLLKEEYKSSNPNRTETIIDELTKNIVENTYLNGNITRTIMRTPQGKLIYEMEYKSGVIARTKNYDEKGNVNIEQTYHSNGQVHFRNEYTKSGKKTTEFDENGDIKK